MSTQENQQMVKKIIQKHDSLPLDQVYKLASNEGLSREATCDALTELVHYKMSVILNARTKTVYVREA